MGKISEIFNFDNIGVKIKNVAKYTCWITIILIWVISPIYFFVLISDQWLVKLCWIPLVLAVVGPILVWIESWFLYAFGQLVQDIHAIRDKEGTTVEKAKREAEEKAKREAEEAEEKAKREVEEKARRDIEEKADREIFQNEFKNLPPMKQPTNYTPNPDWDLKELPIKEVFKRYLDTKEWSEEHRYACYLELMKRLG